MFNGGRATCLSAITFTLAPGPHTTMGPKFRVTGNPETEAEPTYVLMGFMNSEANKPTFRKVFLILFKQQATGFPYGLLIIQTP